MTQQASLEGVVDRIRYAQEGSPFKVAALKTAGAAMPVTIVGELPGLAEGMEVRLTGDWVDDRRYGRQFRAQTYVEMVPATTDGLISYLSSGFIPGIGPKLAERLVAAFGEQTLEVISAHPERLESVDGLGRKRRQTLVKSLKERRGAQEALVFLYGLGITPGLANRIYQRYGDSTVSVVRQNPYRVAEEVHGVGFARADQVARGLSIERDSPARVRAGVYHTLLQARSEGHCFVPRLALLRAAAGLLGLPEHDVSPGLTALAMDRRVVLDALDGSDESAVYLTPLYEAETRLSARLMLLLDALGDAQTSSRDVADRVDRAEALLQMQLAAGQRQALVTALTHGFTVITGGPGTGKTTIIRALLQAAGTDRARTALAAPTGRAAKRMAEATGYPARTIHRLLEFSPVEQAFQRNEDAPLDADLIIVDEASMLDVIVCNALVRAIEPGARVVFVGDVDQLPPVGAGAPFTDIIRSSVVPVARLDRIFRQDAGSAIIDNAHAVNAGRVPKVTKPGTPVQDFYFIEREEPPQILAMMEHLVVERIPRRFGLDPVDDVQVLSPMRNGVLGIHNLNDRLQELLNPDSGAATQALTHGTTTFRVGDKVMQMRNDYDRNVFNGDTGRVSQIDRQQGRLVVAMDQQAVVYEKEQLDELVLAYAVSVHKSQGSEYAAVVIPVSTQHFKMLQRNLIYTAITRGRQLVVLVGTTKAMGIAVRNGELSQRGTLLAQRLSASAGGGHIVDLGFQA